MITILASALVAFCLGLFSGFEGKLLTTFSVVATVAISILNFIV